MPNVVNPYTFVPLPDVIDRREPAGHSRAGSDRLTGELTLTLRALTHLMIGGFAAAAAGQPRDVPRHAVTGEVMLPGSGIAGAIRSVHEALTGGCLRVVDPEYVPIHRHLAIKDDLSNVEFGVVAAVDDEGRATSVIRCTDLVGIEQALLRNAAPPGGAFATGDVIAFPENAAKDVNGRRLLRARDVDAAQVSRVGALRAPIAGTYVLLVTDTAARPKERRVNGHDVRTTAYFSAGKVSDTRLEVDPKAVATFHACLASADDLRPANKSLGSPAPGSAGLDGARFVPVRWPGPADDLTLEDTWPIVGWRLKASPRFHVGQPIRYRVNKGKVGEIRLAHVWRRQGTIPLGERIGDFAPCTDPGHLCPSCRLFGSAGMDARDDDAGSRQQSYRGHVRLEDATPCGGNGQASIVATRTWRPAPLAAPKPSAGQFYLDHSRVPAELLALPDVAPAATWGSLADTRPPEPRPIRGRKFYWRTSNPTQPLQGGAIRGERRGHQRELGPAEVVLIEPNSTFSCRLTFENLHPAQVGALVAAIDPRRLWPGGHGGRRVVTSIGGGRPFGFGAVSITVAPVRIETAASRYTGSQAPVPTLDECLDAFRAVGATTESATPAARATWADLRAALSVDHVPNHEVWYPAISGHPGEEAFDHAYEFFGQTRGQQVKVKVQGQLRIEDRPLVGPALPSADGPAQRVRPDVRRRQA